jgi:DNA-binding transcriptional ArsR family regulator
VQDGTLVLDKPEQLKALGHPLRVRVLEMLGQEGDSRNVSASTPVTSTSMSACC